MKIKRKMESDIKVEGRGGMKCKRYEKCWKSVNVKKKWVQFYKENFFFYLYLIKTLYV